MLELFFVVSNKGVLPILIGSGAGIYEYNALQVNILPKSLAKERAKMLIGLGYRISYNYYLRCFCQMLSCGIPYGLKVG